MNQIRETRMEQARAIVDRGIVTNILPDRESFLERLASQTPMRIYIGADPTSTSLHLSHAKNYMLLEEFRQLGHEVIVLFGDFTARIGDPTDRESARKQLTGEEVTANVSKWLDQIRPLMDFDVKENPPQVKFNADWLAGLTMENIIELTSMVTVQRMLERDMFERRIREQKPIHVHEFMYPLMQGYDSVAMDVDVELCGTDQTFNALMGRTLLNKLKNKDKFIVTVNLMENPKTGELMSKSRGTGVFLDASAFDMYGSIMAQPDEMIELFLINNTRVSLSDVAEIMREKNPRDAKMRTAFEVTQIFYGYEEAHIAQERFVRLVQCGEADEKIPVVSSGQTEPTVFSLVRNALPIDSYSNNKIHRLIEQGSIKIDGRQYRDRGLKISIPPEGLELKVGKKLWFKVIIK